MEQQIQVSVKSNNAMGPAESSASLNLGFQVCSTVDDLLLRGMIDSSPCERERERERTVEVLGLGSVDPAVLLFASLLFSDYMSHKLLGVSKSGHAWGVGVRMSR